MDHVTLAQFDREDLINLALFAIIFLGSVIGGFLKWLVAKFRDAALEKEKRLPPPPSRSSGLEGQADAERPVMPMARPMPPRPMATLEMPPDTVRSRKSREIHGRRARVAPGHKAVPKRALAPELPSRPPPVDPAPRHRNVPFEDTPPAGGRLPETLVTTVASGLEDGGELIGHLDPEHHLGLTTEGTGQIGQGSASTQRSDSPGGASVPGRPDSLRHPTRTTLRRTVILQEILGPPVALRHDDPYA